MVVVGIAYKVAMLGYAVVELYKVRETKWLERRRESVESLAAAAAVVCSTLDCTFLGLTYQTSLSYHEKSQAGQP